VLKKFILGSLLLAGLTACPIEPIVPPQPASPKAINDPQSINPNTASSITIRPADNDIFDSSASRVLSSIDLDANKGGQQLKYDDLTGRGTFSLNTSTGVVTFKPTAGITGTALATYTIKDSNGNVSNPAKIEVTISTSGPLKVLFIGNSRTWYKPCTAGYAAYNIPEMVQAMASPQLQVTYSSTISCGVTLKQHLSGFVENGVFKESLSAIRSGGWNYVVLQPHTDELSDPTTLRATIKAFNDEVVRVGAKTILVENWWLKGSKFSLSSITSTTNSIASSLGLRIVPVGNAWNLSALSEDALFNGDGIDPSNSGIYKHATPLGAYVAASAYYAVFYPSRTIPTTLPPGLSITTTDASSARNGAQSAYNNLSSVFK
jgi:hypothetical protein